MSKFYKGHFFSYRLLLIIFVRTKRSMLIMIVEHFKIRSSTNKMVFSSRLLNESKVKQSNYIVAHLNASQTKMFACYFIAMPMDLMVDIVWENKKVEMLLIVIKFTARNGTQIFQSNLSRYWMCQQFKKWLSKFAHIHF